MFAGPLAHNVLSWMLQSTVIACVAAILPILLRVRHPRIQLAYCHAVLALCLLLPLMQPWRAVAANSGFVSSIALHGRWVLGALGAGVVVHLAWMSGGLWRIRRYRIGATPLYPIPEAMQAAASITNADALFCVSEDATGPVMLGWLAPVVLLPSSFLTLDEEAQCGIACHELLHVRRGDWLVTLIEGFVGALLWFNPGAWLLLSEARLAREQLVDAESVRLTASREPYIDALLAIAREHVWSDLAVAPSFLRRSHLTQRMQLLLSDAPISLPRLVGSFCSIAGILGCSIWFACVTFPMLGQVVSLARTAQTPQAPPVMAFTTPAIAAPMATTRTPAPQSPGTAPFTDPYEPVGGGVEAASSPDLRASAVALLAKARAGALRHVQGMPPYRFDVSFTAGGSALNTGAGEISETWMTGQKWRWTASVGDVSHLQLLYQGALMEDRHLAVIPMRAHMLRNEALWATRWFGPNARLRTAKVQWQGKSTTCVLGSEPAGDSANVQGREWDEEEYCVDDASGDLVVHSLAPGTYAQFGYDGNVQFHGLHLPDRIRIYVAGALVVDGIFHIADATADDEGSLLPAAGMTSDPRPVALGSAVRMRISAAPEGDASIAQPVIVHAEIDSDGTVVEAELSAAANAALVPAALKQVRETNFGHTGTERQGYIDVRFTGQ